MSRKTVNILMSILVIIYTVFVIAHLITAVDDPMSENRVLSILASGVGAIVGIWLAVLWGQELINWYFSLLW